MFHALQKNIFLRQRLAVNMVWEKMVGISLVDGAQLFKNKKIIICYLGVFLTFWNKKKIQGWVFQYFDNVRHNLATQDAFAKVMKMLSHTGLSSSATHLIYSSSSGHSLGIRGFRPIGPCIIIKILAAWVKFLESPDYCTVINWIFTFHTPNAFGCFFSVMAQFTLVKHKFLN